MSRFVAALLQGLNCLAIPPGVAPFHSVSSFRVEDHFFNLLDIRCENVSGLVAQVILINKDVIVNSIPIKKFLFKHLKPRRYVSGSDFPASRQLIIEADLSNHAPHIEISQPSSAKGEPTQ
ncbi:hypothetical protein R0K17_13840 [Planococcus sp. SIMBA_143]